MGLQGFYRDTVDALPKVRLLFIYMQIDKYREVDYELGDIAQITKSRHGPNGDR